MTEGLVPTTQQYVTVGDPAGFPAAPSRLAVFGPVPVPMTLTGVPVVTQFPYPLVVKAYEVPYPELVLLQLVEANTLR